MMMMRRMTMMMLMMILNEYIKVRWTKDNLDGYLNFYSVSGDGNFHTFRLPLSNFHFHTFTFQLPESTTLAVPWSKTKRNCYGVILCPNA